MTLFSRILRKSNRDFVSTSRRSLLNSQIKANRADEVTDISRALHYGERCEIPKFPRRVISRLVFFDFF